MRHYKKYVTLLCAILIPITLIAQQGSVSFNHLDIEDGLSQSTVQAVFQDSEGYLWIGTQDGLNKFNGYDITVYESDPEDSTTISDNDIRAIYEDDEGRLWIGTQSGGLNLYNRDKDTFSSFNIEPDDWRTLSANSVWAIIEDSYDIFWVGTSYGLNKMDRETGVVQRIYADTTALSDNQITVLYEDSEKNLWIGTSNGINLYNRSDSTFTRYLYKSNHIGADSYYIRSIYEDSQGRFWVGTESKGLLHFDWKNETIKQYSHNPNDPTSISDNAVFALLESKDGHLWVGTGNGGLNLMNIEEESFNRFQYRPEDPQSLSNDGVNTLYQSREGIIWVGTFAGGLDFFDPSPSKFEHYKNQPINPSSLSNDVVQSFYQDRNRGIWIGTDGGGLNRFDPATGRFEQFRHDPGNPNSVSANVILDISETDRGLWLGTYAGGTTLFDYENNEFTRFQNDPNDSTSLSSDFVFVICEKSDGTIWFGTNLGGVSVYNPQTNEFNRYIADPDQPYDPETISNNDIRSIFEDSNGDMWIGSYGGMLDRYDNEEDRFYLYDINANSSLYASVVQDIYEDKEGRLWLATRGGGLKRFIRETNEAITFSEADGLPSNIIHAIEEDEKGNLWLSTNNGISRFSVGTESFFNFGMDHGLQSREFNPGSSMKDNSGYLYFGGVNGFNRFLPENVKIDSTVSPVVLTDLLLFNRSVPIGGKDSPLQKQISQTDQLTLDYDASVITFEFAALNYSEEKGNQFAYKMEGFDEDWNFIGDFRRATYTNLNPGEYTFRVMAANSDGVWDEAGVSLPIVITPPFWRTAWFLFLMFVLLLGTAYLIFWLRIRSIRSRNRMLSTIVSARTEELQKANATKDKLFSIIAHDLINISTGLSGLSDLMKESVENDNMDEVKEYSSHLHNTISQFSTMLKNMLDWARSQTGKIQYDPINFKVIDAVDEIVSQYESRAIYKNINLKTDLDEDLCVHADPDMVLVILRNLVANALKFTGEGGEIRIYALEEDGYIKISVSDTGIGMSEEMVQKIFNDQESITTMGTSNEKGTGLGISLCQDFVRKNNGKMSVKSKKSEGTTISFILPVQKEEPETYSNTITQAS